MNKIFIRTFIIVLFFCSGHARASNTSDPIDGIFNGIYGNTIFVIVPSLVTKSPVADQNQSGELSFQFNADTVYKNFNQMTDLMNGDPVRVQYKEDLSGKVKQPVASAITKLELQAPPVTTSGAAAKSDNIAPNAAPQTVTTTTTSTTTTRVNPQ